MSRPARRERGFTLVELMVAMTLVTVLVAVAFQIAIVVISSHKQHRQAVAVQRAARGSLDLIADAVRNASAGVPTAQLTDAAGCTVLSAISVVDDDNGPDELSLITAAGGTVTSLREVFDEDSTEMVVLDGTGVSAGDLVLITDFDVGHVVRVTSVLDQGDSWTFGIEPIGCAGAVLTYSPGALVLRAKVIRYYVEDLDGVPTLFMDPDGDGGDAAEPLAEGIEDFQVAVGVDADADGTVLDDEGPADEWFYNAAGDLTPPVITTLPWRALRLTVVARSLTEDEGAEVSTRPEAENHDGETAADGYRRRGVSTTVEIRNLAGSP
jgi:prepilin-type N-terminal cleavage/methylation domain-containing protein